MVQTAAQMMAFFENDQQMAIPHDMVIQLQQEGITMVDDLADVDKDFSPSWLTTYDVPEVVSQTQTQLLPLMQ